MRPSESPSVNPLGAPEIEESELKAARAFLNSARDELRQARMPHVLRGEAAEMKGPGPILRNGIARARVRSATVKSTS